MSADLLGGDNLTAQNLPVPSLDPKGNSWSQFDSESWRGLATLILIFAVLVLGFVALRFINKTLSLTEAILYYTGLGIMAATLLIVNFMFASTVCFGITVVGVSLAVINGFLLSSDFGDNGLVELFDLIILLLLIWFLFETGSWIGFGFGLGGLVLMTLPALSREPDGTKAHQF